MSDSTIITPVLTTNNELLRNITSFEDAARALADAGIEPTNYSEEFGSGFRVASETEKRSLIGVPFIALGLRLAPGEYMREGEKTDFAVLHIVTKTGEKLILTDGSTGICDQVKEVLAKGITAGLYVAGGLRVSDYDYTDEKGNVSPASTFYLSM